MSDYQEFVNIMFGDEDANGVSSGTTVTVDATEKHVKLRHTYKTAGTYRIVAYPKQKAVVDLNIIIKDGNVSFKIIPTYDNNITESEKSSCIEYVRLYKYGSNGKVVAQTDGTADADGYYIFNDLEIGGVYNIEIGVAMGYCVIRAKSGINEIEADGWPETMMLFEEPIAIDENVSEQWSGEFKIGTSTLSVCFVNTHKYKED